ncbi:DUF368 domain-containing protein [archaeon]|nr:DUF368 domain-containing protein [archaeon]
MRFMKLKESFLIFLRGLFMGSADVVPGVSGGTIALITGIYERLIGSISFLVKFILLILKFKFKDLIKEFRKIDFGLFIPLGLGISIAVFFISGIINVLLDKYTGITFGFFFGLILGSSLYLYTHVDKLNYKRLIFSIIGFFFAYFIAGFSALQVNHSLFVIFISGVLAISAMILPGISGAFILLLLNQYQYLIDVLHDFRIKVIFVFFLGAISGLLIFSRVLDLLLRRFKFLTLSFLIGLMLGSLRIPWRNIVNSNSSLFLVILFGLVGFVLVYFLEKKFNEN